MSKNLKIIEDYAFCNCRSLKSISIPSTVTNIGKYAFEECTSLKSISIPQSVNTICEYAFETCTGLQTVDIAAKKILYNAFAFCDSLTKVTFKDGVTMIDTGAFQRTNIETLKFPDSLKAIGTDAFQECYNLSSIKFGSGLETIGNTAFYLNRFNCDDRLREIDIPGNVKKIGYRAFYRRSNLDKITLHNGLETIGIEAFYDCDIAEYIMIPETVSEIGTNAFGYICGDYYCTNNSAAKMYAMKNDIDYILIPSCVNNLKASATSSTVKLTWSKATDADGYIIKQYNGKKWIQIDKIKGNSNTSYTIKKLKSGKTYKYCVCGYKAQNGDDVTGYVLYVKVKTSK